MNQELYKQIKTNINTLNKEIQQLKGKLQPETPTFTLGEKIMFTLTLASVVVFSGVGYIQILQWLLK